MLKIEGAIHGLDDPTSPGDPFVSENLYFRGAKSFSTMNGVDYYELDPDEPLAPQVVQGLRDIATRCQTMADAIERECCQD